MIQVLKRLLIVYFLTVFSSCMYPQRVVSYKEIVESYDQYNTYRTIHIDTTYKYTERYIEFENKVAVILLDVKDFLNYANNKLNDSLLCLPKKQYLENLADTIKHYSTNLYFIERMIPPDMWKKLSYPNSKKYQKEFIPPYGYENQIDTVNKKRLESLKNWIISDLCIEGKCLVLDKRGAMFVDKIFYLITDFKDGHGGEMLLFEDKKNFFNVEVYSDIKWPNFDCMSSDEIRKWNEDIKKKYKEK